MTRRGHAAQSKCRLSLAKGRSFAERMTAISDVIRRADSVFAEDHLARRFASTAPGRCRLLLACRHDRNAIGVALYHEASSRN